MMYGTPQEHQSSMPRLASCMAIRKKPSSPQAVPQLLRPTQYLCAAAI